MLLRTSAGEAVEQELEGLSPGTLGEDLSKKGRDESGLTGTNLAYGELSAGHIHTLIQRIKHHHSGLPEDGSGVLVDLGSGTGKALLAGSDAHAFKRAWGVELVESLHLQALTNLKHWQGRDRATTAVDFLQGDLSEVTWWQDATVVIIHATVFDPDLMAHIQWRAEQCPVGVWFLVVTKELRCGPITGIETVEMHRCLATWGEATVYLQRRVDMEEG
ncbi:unnamed protein product [Chrysoparadoxa australica]